MATRPRRRHARRGWRGGPLIAAGAVVAIGAMVGTGFVVQTTVAAQNESIAATAALTAAADLDVEQLGSHAGILEARAVELAEATLNGAGDTIAAAQGKTDATQLASSVAALDDYKLLAPERVFDLVDTTKSQTANVQAAVAEADRIAAEQAAAAAAAKAAADAAAQAEQVAAAAPSRPSAPSNPTEAQAIARSLMASMYGWGDDQFGCLVSLWGRESGWNVYAENTSSGAYGIPQALPGSKMSTAGDDWATSATTQITWGLGYIAGRYGTPCGAWDHSESVGWY
ncbi:hypothetical protein J7E25_04665 [Agromyces sp. ISL-38]|uniref:aggregation-promoting factor C-terminal-like domain-containing protein n=1 Tax=Agromyces sp. ISL-38 TaxID=2819107 RepID=UPI001BEAA66B|nr:hypothetical protein [Agromyces sp. ISL-38]MBT2498379.1 hypothetical protein [Agromyces sp. ISL-38]MBT2518987.1 hypothetical protein [Streptomyces sp. ISL-90]